MIRLSLLALVALLFSLVQAQAATPVITGQDANNKTVTINGKGRYTLVLYTNPDLEEESRSISLALDKYRAKSNFEFIRVVDLRGGVPPGMRSIVKGHISEEEVKETARLKKAGIKPGNPAPILPDFTGPTLDTLGWEKIYDEVQVVLFDAKGKEVKRLSDCDAVEVVKLVQSAMES